MIRKLIHHKVLWLVLLVMLIYPFETTVVPAWRLQVVDTAGDPVAGIGINYYWQHYGIEWNGNEERTETDENGSVSFSERTTRASLLQRAAVGLSNTLNFIHSSWGRSGHIVIYGRSGKYETASVSYDGSYSGEGTPPPTKVVLKRAQPPPN